MRFPIEAGTCLGRQLIQNIRLGRMMVISGNMRGRRARIPPRDILSEYLFI